MHRTWYESGKLKSLRIVTKDKTTTGFTTITANKEKNKEIAALRAENAALRRRD